MLGRFDSSLMDDYAFDIGDEYYPYSLWLNGYSDDEEFR
jgi:hypothetical protein